MCHIKLIDYLTEEIFSWFHANALNKYRFRRKEWTIAWIGSNRINYLNHFCNDVKMSKTTCIHSISRQIKNGWGDSKVLTRLTRDRQI